MTVKHLTILSFSALLFTSCGRKAEVREYVEIVQRPASPETPPVAQLPEDPMRAAPLTVEPVPANLPPDHPTMVEIAPPTENSSLRRAPTAGVPGASAAGPNVMAGRESEVPPPPKVENLTWDLPPGWKMNPGKGMRIAEFYPEPENPQALVTLIALSGGAGSMDANIARWRAQIGLSRTGASRIQHIDGKQHFEFLTLVQESQDLNLPQSITAAIYQQRDRTLFLKFMGPTEIVAAHKLDFLQLAGSLDQKENTP